MLAISSAAHKKKKATAGLKSRLLEIWLPFIQAYRTLCIAPTLEMKAVFHDFRQIENGHLTQEKNHF